MECGPDKQCYTDTCCPTKQPKGLDEHSIALVVNDDEDDSEERSLKLARSSPSSVKAMKSAAAEADEMSTLESVNGKSKLVVAYDSSKDETRSQLSDMGRPKSSSSDIRPTQYQQSNLTKLSHTSLSISD